MSAMNDDPMDYSMESQANQQSPPGCHDQGPQSYSHPDRNARTHYDPVHDPEYWYNNPYSGVNQQSRPHFLPPNPQPQFPQWGAPSHMSNGWQRYGGDIQSGAQSQGQNPSGHRPPAGSMPQPSWADFQGYTLPFGYGGPYTGSSTRPGGSMVPNQSIGTSIQMPPTGGDATQLPIHSNPVHNTNALAQQTSLDQSLSGRAHPSSATQSDSSRQRPNHPHVERFNRNPTPPVNLTESDQSAAARISRMNSLMDRRMDNLMNPPRRRREIPAWPSDDEDDLDLEAEQAERDLFLRAAGVTIDDERIMAAYRGQMKLGPKVPTKEAIASLEVVALEDMKELRCDICFNDMGTSNPEGVIETPLRLPNCRHIFGDTCIKIWFEKSDTCPLCRDALPSEVPNRRSVAMESFRASRLYERERMAVLAAATGHRSRHSNPPRYPFSEDSARSSTSSQQRTREDQHELMVARTAMDIWSSPFPNRNSPADSPEGRRRQARGRVGGGRAPHMLGRPTSVGSARFTNSTTSHLGTPQRGQFHGNSGNSGNNHTSRRSITPSLTRQGSGEIPNTTNTQTSPSQNQLPSSFEEASFPAVDNSNENISGFRTQPRSRMTAFSEPLGGQLDGPFGNRRSPSPSAGTNVERDQSRLFSTGPPPSFAEFRRLEARYRARGNGSQDNTGGGRWSQ